MSKIKKLERSSSKNKMKIARKTRNTKQDSKTKSVNTTDKEHVVIVAQEIKFARLLSANEKKSRDRSLKMLKKWLLNCFDKGYEFKEDDFMRIWKGLFYAVWMSDKPLIQEELCDNISGILDLFPPEQYRHALTMVKIGLRALATEWYGIDHHRMDKCLMLVRRYLRGSLRCVARMSWSEHACQKYANMLSGKDGILSLQTPAYVRNATSMILHVVDCFLEEVAKVSEGSIPPSSLAALLRPFCSYMCSGAAPAVCAACRRLLTALVRQSDLGLRYEGKRRAWEQMGCPEGGPDALELVSDEDDEQSGDESDNDDCSEKPLDPRAGRVDVILPTLPVPSEEIADMLAEMLAHTSSRAHKRAKICMQRFKELAKNSYPLQVEPIPLAVGPAPRPSVAARALHMLEKKLVADTDELALRGLSRKHRKRLLAKSRAGMSIIEDVAALVASHNNAAGDWKVEDTQPQAKKQKQKDTSNKENVNKKLEKRKLEKQNSDDTPSKKQKVDVKNKDKTKKEKQKKDKSKTLVKVDSVEKTDNVLDVEAKRKKPVEKQVKTTKKPTNEASKFEPYQAKPRNASILAKKIKNFQKQLSPKNDRKVEKKTSFDTPKKVKFVLKNNSMQGTIDYYKSVRQSPNIPFDSSRKPSKTNLKPSTPSPINPFFKKKLKLKYSC